MSKLEDIHTLVRLLKEFKLPVSPILEYAIMEKLDHLSSNGENIDSVPDIGVQVDDRMVGIPEKQSVAAKKKPSSIRIVRSNGTVLECETSAKIMSQTIKEIGARKVYDLKIPIDGMYLVTVGGNPQYPTAQHEIGDGFFVNTHSNTKTKIRQLEKIFKSLDMDWKVEII